MGRKPLDGHSGEVGEQLSDRLSLVHGAVVPDEDHRPAQVLGQFADEDRDRVGVEVIVGERLEEEVESPGHGGQGKAGDGRDFLALVTLHGEDGCFPSGREGAADEGREEDAGLVDQNDMGFLASPFFRMRGQSRATQRSIRSWSRSRARFCGFCGVMSWLVSQALR